MASLGAAKTVAKPGLDAELAELALKIEAELSEDLRSVVCFTSFGDGKSLVVDWAVQLEPLDLKALSDVAVRYGGDYVNVPGLDGKDRGCFQIPKPKPAVAVQVEGTKKRDSPIKDFGRQNCIGCEDEVYCGKTKGRMALCLEVQKVGLLKAVLSEQNKQAFAVYSKIVEQVQAPRQDSSPVVSVAKVEPQKTLLPTLKPKSVEDLRILFPADLDQLLCFEQKPDHVKVTPEGRLEKDVFAKVARIIEGVGGEYVSAGYDSHFRVPAAPKVSKPAETVQRNTRPTEGHVDLGIIWTNAEGPKGAFEKATEKDNMNKEAYFQLQDWIVDHEKNSFQDGFFYWIFTERNAIGRKRTQQRGRS